MALNEARERGGPAVDRGREVQHALHVRLRGVVLERSDVHARIRIDRPDLFVEVALTTLAEAAADGGELVRALPKRGLLDREQ
jgi:hypothetical protein